VSRIPFKTVKLSRLFCFKLLRETEKMLIDSKMTVTLDWTKIYYKELNPTYASDWYLKPTVIQRISMGATMASMTPMT
jgi:hypothetical protein